ncbi:MAG: hypothetical protein ACOX68_04340 [Candidatus Limivicinus sp.]|jgi:hypothetical protein
MKKAWQIVIAIVLIAALLGAVCLGVGLITGAEYDRIFTVLDERYSLKLYYDYLIHDLIPAFQEAGVI